MFQKMKVAVLIPALDEAEALPGLLRAIPAWVDRVIVADNGSKDATYKIADSREFHPNSEAVKEARKGYGNACLKAMSVLRDEDFIVFLDADHSDDPAGMASLLEPLVQDRADCVISNRFGPRAEKGSMSPPQWFGNKLAVTLIRLGWGYRYFDLGPFRSIRADALGRLGMRDPNYGWTIELQVKALRHGLRVAQVDVPYRCRRLGKSKVSANLAGIIRAGWKFVTIIAWYKIEELIGRERPRSRIRRA